MIDRVFWYIYWRIIIWMLEVFFQLSVALLRVIFPVLTELFGVTARICVRLLSYSDSWVVIAVVTLWMLTDHGIFAVCVALMAIATVFTSAIVRARAL